MADLVTITQLQNMLKDFYQETKHDEPMEVSVRMWDEIYKNTKDVDGVAVKFIAKVRRNLGIQTTSFQNSDEPTSGYRGYERATVQPRFIKAKGQFDQQLVLMSKTDTGSFVKELVGITEDLDESVRLNLARQIFGDGSGKIAELTADVTAGAGVTVYVHSTQYIEVGMPLNVYNAAGVYVESITVTSYDPETSSLVATTSNNFQAMYYLALGESAAITSNTTEVTGLNAAIDKSNTYFGINRANFPVWRGSTVGVGTGVANRASDMSEANMAKVINGVMKRSRKKDVDGATQAFDFLITDYEAYTKYWNGLTATRRYMDNVDYKTGVTGLLVDNKKVERDAYCIKEHAALGRMGAPTGGPVYHLPSTAGLTNGDNLEVYSGNTLIGHLNTVSVTNGTDFAATFVAYNGGVIAAGQVVYLDNSGLASVAFSAPRVLHNMYFINKDTWQWFIWQDITNYTEQLIGLEFVKVANKTQYEFTLTGLMELATDVPTKNGRYRFTVEPSWDAALSM